MLVAPLHAAVIAAFVGVVGTLDFPDPTGGQETGDCQGCQLDSSNMSLTLTASADGKVYIDASETDFSLENGRCLEQTRIIEGEPVTSCKKVRCLVAATIVVFFTDGEDPFSNGIEENEYSRTTATPANDWGQIDTDPYTPAPVDDGNGNWGEARNITQTLPCSGVANDIMWGYGFDVSPGKTGSTARMATIAVGAAECSVCN